MQLTRAADYAVRVMIHLGSRPAGAIAHARLAAEVDCPQQFLAKLLQRLVRAGLIRSRRGKVGGFELTGAGRQSSMLQVVEAIEGPIRLNLCLESPYACDRRPACPAHLVWARAQAALVNVLKSATIEELVLQAAAMREVPDCVSEVPRWT